MSKAQFEQNLSKKINLLKFHKRENVIKFTFKHVFFQCVFPIKLLIILKIY
jgi:hypothetical protein